MKHESFLLYATAGVTRIKGISLSANQTLPGGGNQETIVPVLNVETPVAFDYNVKEQLLYFRKNDEYVDEVFENFKCFWVVKLHFLLTEG